MSAEVGVEISANAGHLYAALAAERQQSLVAPLDDMWATFGDRAERYALLVGGELAGCCSIDDVDRLHVFFVRNEFEELAQLLSAKVVHEMGVVAALASTVEPAFLSLSLAAGGRAESVALMFEHGFQPMSSEPVVLRTATHADHRAAVVFDRVATGSSAAFLEPFLTERIDRSELHLLEIDGEIVGTGESRVDQRVSGYAHLGVVVGQGHRGQGLGTAIMHGLVDTCRGRELIPLCSTEPDNLAAQRVIRRTGFRSRHRVFRVPMTNSS